MLTPDTPPLELRRDELLARVEYARPRILAVVAPPGFGKSTFVRQWIAGREGVAVCDCAGVRDELDLARRALAALAQAVPSLEEAVQTMQRGLADGGSSVAQRANAALEVWRSPGEAVVVFESAEHAAGSPAVRAYLGQLLAALPAGRRCAVVSNAELHRTLTKSAAPHEILILRAADLAFGPGELRALFAGAATPAQIERVAQFSQGWPVAAALARRLGDFSFDSLRDYVIDEVLAPLGEPLGAALFACAAIPDATAAELDEALGDSAAFARFERFAAESPFVMRGSDGALRVHPLLAVALFRGREERCSALLAAAAAASEARGAFVRAATLHAARGDAESAARVLARHEIALDRRPSPAYARVLASLDRMWIVRHPRLWGIACMQRLFCSSMDALLDEAELVWRTMPSTATALERFSVFVFRVLLMNYLGALDRAGDAIDAFARTTAEAGVPELGEWIEFLRALLAARRGRLSEADAGFARALPAAERVDAMASGAFLTLGADVARVRGERSLERQSIDRALDIARHAELPNLAALALAEAAFGAWLAGEDEAAQAFAAELAMLVARAGVRGLAYFSAVACGEAAAPRSGESLRHVALGHLIAAAAAGEAEAAELARRALDAAVAYDSPPVECLAAMAVGLVDPAAFDEAVARALAAAERCDSPALRAAVAAVAAQRGDAGMLAPFAARFRRRNDRVAPLDIEVCSGSVRVDGAVVPLGGREAELLFALALRPEPTPRIRLAMMLWPELDEDAARNALSVCLHRLRAHLGKEAVERSGEGYRLNPRARVDAWDIERIAAALPPPPHLNAAQRAALERCASLLQSERPVRMGEWEWFATSARRLDGLRAEFGYRLAEDAFVRGEAREALARAQELIAHDALDEPAQELAIRAHFALGDRAGALRQFRQYREVLQTELQCEPSAALTAMVRS